MKRPFACPVCGGNGLVPRGFYNQTSGDWSTTDITPEPCRSCENGIIWGFDEPCEIEFYNTLTIACETCKHFISPTVPCGKECEVFSAWERNEKLKLKITQEEIDHLMWVHDRLINVYKESNNDEFLIRFRIVIEKLKQYL